MTLSAEYPKNRPNDGGASKAIEDAERGRIRTDRVVAQAAASLGALRKLRQQNHFIETLGTIFEGNPH